MIGTKKLAGMALLAATMTLGANAFAATATPTGNATHDTKAHCEQQARDKGLTGSKLADFVKKCQAEAQKK